MKNNKKNTTAEGNVISLVSIDDERRKLQTALAALNEQQKKAKEEHAVRMKEKIDGLPAYFGVKTVPEALRLIRRNVRGVAGGHRIPAETKAKIEKALKDGAVTMRDIADEHGVSIPTIFTIKQRLGLVQSRNAPAPQVPAKV